MTPQSISASPRYDSESIIININAMLITRTADGLYVCEKVYTTVNGQQVLVNRTKPYVGRTAAEVIVHAYSNAMVRGWRSSLARSMSIS